MGRFRTVVSNDLVKLNLVGETSGCFREGWQRRRRQPLLPLRVAKRHFATMTQACDTTQPSI